MVIVALCVSKKIFELKISYGIFHSFCLKHSPVIILKVTLLHAALLLPNPHRKIFEDIESFQVAWCNALQQDVGVREWENHSNAYEASCNECGRRQVECWFTVS